MAHDTLRGKGADPMAMKSPGKHHQRAAKLRRKNERKRKQERRDARRAQRAAKAQKEGEKK